MALKVARRASIPPFIAMEMLRAANARAAAGERVLHLELGQPDGGAPQAVIEAATAALKSHRLGYTEALGIPPLRAAIAAHYRQSYGLDLDPGRVVVTTGSSGAFMLGFLAAFEAGDRIALAAPGYPAYRNILLALDLEPVDLAVGPRPIFSRRRPCSMAWKGLDGLILASPSNPTGSMLDRRALTALVDYCRDRGIRLVSDEIYHGIVYGAETVSAASLDETAIVVNSFSKYFSMTGWRLGWMLVPADLARAVECLAQNLFISAPTLPQIAAEASSAAGRSSTPGSPFIGAIATCCWPSCPRPVSPASRRPMAPSISMPISAI
jgi:Aspartate/tyrosine/aromatic aminotransferase